VSLSTRLVLDTNVVLDWLVFADPQLQRVSSAVAAARLTLLTHSPALEELQRVVAYPALKLDATRQASVLSHYQAQSQLAILPSEFSLQNLQLPANFPRCRDPDDQHFLALAYHSSATLVSRDRQVLRLTRRVARFGVPIISVAELDAAMGCSSASLLSVISHRDG
jgi:putative PIN family toxin of toxin-antitoxin system